MKARLSAAVASMPVATAATRPPITPATTTGTTSTSAGAASLTDDRSGTNPTTTNPTAAAPTRPPVRGAAPGFGEIGDRIPTAYLTKSRGRVPGLRFWWGKNYVG